MAGNTFGTAFKVTTFGESHGAGVGAVIDGCPSGLMVDVDFIQQELNKRKPGQSELTTARKEKDEFEILSGLYEGKTTGAPLAFFIRNQDQHSQDYEHLKDTYRPSHADFTYEKKYGIRDYRGGGRSSARETAARVIAGAVAQLLLKHSGVAIHAFVSQVGEVIYNFDSSSIDFSLIENTPVRCPDLKVAEQMISLIEEVKSTGDTIGGIVSCVIKNTIIGLGDPVFDKLHADLAKAMMSINAAHGFDYGAGFAAVALRGSQLNDRFINNDSAISTDTNNSGGIQGGISNGQDIFFRVLFKPVATLMQSQQTVNKEMDTVLLAGKGRHDPCVLPRAVPIVQAMAAMVMADHLLKNKMVML